MAFVSTFLGTTSLTRTPVLSPRSSHSTSMKFGTDEMLKKYDDMTRKTPVSATSSRPSTIWSTYSRTLLDRFAPTRREMFAPKGSYAEMMDAMILQSKRFVAPGGSPIATPADAYMASCVERQYKQTACTNGIYGTSCTEGTIRGAADDARVLALGARFREGQRSTSAKFGDFFANRRRAVIATHECSYEETLVARYPKVAEAMLKGMSEANGACVRYANPTDPAEKYMMDSVVRQNMAMAVPMGVYAVTCQDGAAAGLPEFKRVQALAARFRAGHVPESVLEDRKFAARKWGRENFAGPSGYEEELFNRYPASAMAMRVESARY